MDSKPRSMMKKTHTCPLFWERAVRCVNQAVTKKPHMQNIRPSTTGSHSFDSLSINTINSSAISPQTKQNKRTVESGLAG